MGQIAPGATEREPDLGRGLLLIDDHLAIAQALASAFRTSGFDPVEALPRAAHDVDGVLEAAARLRPALALVDINLGTDRSGLRLIGPLAGAGVKVIAFTAHDEESVVAACVEAGAVGFLSKSEAFDHIIDYLRRVLSGEQVIPPHRRHELLDLARRKRTAGDARLTRIRKLTASERAVLGALLEGRSAKQIAADRDVAVGTVRHQIEAIRTKLNVRSQLAAVALAREVDWQLD